MRVPAAGDRGCIGAVVLPLLRLAGAGVGTE